MKLAVADVDGVHALGPACEEEVGEATGRSPDVKADAAAGVETEVVERRRQLHAAARHIRVRRLGTQDDIRGDLVRSLHDGDLICHHAAGGDGGLRLGAAFEQAAFNEQAVDANARCHQRS